MSKQKRRKKAPLVWHMAVAVSLALVATGWYWSSLRGFYDGALQAASVFFFDSSTPQSLLKDYKAAHRGRGDFKVLIVPGHDMLASGTSYGGLSEADLTLAEAKLLAAQFEQDKDIEVKVARTGGWYDPELSQYFIDDRANILAYRASQMAQMQAHMADGSIASNVIVDHNTAPAEVALRLYGINKWANEQGYDLILHIHFNDIPRANRALPGPYNGFALYVPEHQFSNAKGSMAVADAIKARLVETGHVSTHPEESSSPTEDQELIAIGSNNSVDASSVLIEYAYIYEPQIQSPYLRQGSLEAYAKETYQGVEDFLNKKKVAVLQ